MNTTPPKAGRAGPPSENPSNKAKPHHEFGTLADMCLWHDPAAPDERTSEMSLSGPQSPDSECTRLM